MPLSCGSAYTIESAAQLVNFVSKVTSEGFRSLITASFSQKDTFLWESLVLLSETSFLVEVLHSDESITDKEVEILSIIISFCLRLWGFSLSSLNLTSFFHFNLSKFWSALNNMVFFTLHLLIVLNVFIQPFFCHLCRLSQITLIPIILLLDSF